MTTPDLELDRATRHQALDPRQSFIVQAPAGSGKTELLIQRYLSLLSTVAWPEEILAITFTHKAADEMRARVNQALDLAQREPPPSSAYQHLTWQLAQQVLKRAQQLQWNLPANPQRLRIQTIDSLCLQLVQHMPLLSRVVTTANTSDGRELLALYEAAAKNLLLSPLAVETQQALQDLLLHLDNNLLQVHDLLVNMLRKRDQWLGLLSGMKHHAKLRHSLEYSLQTLIRTSLQHAETYFPAALLTEADELLRYAMPGLETTVSQKTLAYWQALASLVLTQDQQWRRQVTHQEGFPAKNAGRDKAEKNYFSVQKQRALNLLQHLAPLDDLRAALVAVRLSPPPRYTEPQWQIVSALLHLLPVAAAELKVLFQQYRTADFIEISLAALHALGDTDLPSDLALRLDYQIKHMLVDEFQDTSASQFRLLELLTAGWQADDGRTLFLVGDPMQSIYRFRAAEVGLFLRAQRYGIGQVNLIALTLQVNFRSQANLIDWINRVFPSIFPAHADIASNKVKFTPVRPTKLALPTTVELYYQTENLGANTQKIIALIQQLKLEAPHDSSVVLVRSRRHLNDIIPALQQHNIAYQAIEIEPLAENITVQDLMSLSCALLHPGDRLAWLSLLRSPYCGLTLTDLQIIAENSHNQTIGERLTDDAVLKNLSLDGQQRLSYLCPRLQDALSQRQRSSLRDWIEDTWLRLDGLATLTSPRELSNAETFFALLSQLESCGISINRAILTRQLKTLYAAPAAFSAGAVQLMTIHKAKGLEFDTVIIPAIEKPLQHDPQQLLLWLEQPRENHGSDLLLAPIKAHDDDDDPIYRCLKNQQTRVDEYETTRLLYVAATRARKRLYFFATLELDKDGKLKKPPEKTWLAKLWGSCKTEFSFLASTALSAHDNSSAKRYLQRLKKSV